MTEQRAIQWKKPRFSVQSVKEGKGLEQKHTRVTRTISTLGRGERVNFNSNAHLRRQCSNNRKKSISDADGVEQGKRRVVLPSCTCKNIARTARHSLRNRPLASTGRRAIHWREGERKKVREKKQDTEGK